MFLRSLQCKPLFLILLLYSIYVFAWFDHVMDFLLYPWAVDYGEMPEISRAWKLSQGQTMYPSWDSLPLNVANYTPLYSILNALFIGLVGPTPFTGRLISILSVILTVFVLYKILRRLSSSLPLALLGSSLYVSSHMVWMWSPLVRVDNLAVLFQISGLFFALDYVETKEKRSFHRTIFCCLLAAFTRQTMIATCAATLFSLLLTDRKIFFRSVLLFALLGSFGVGLLMVSTGFSAWQHLVSSNLNEFGTEMMVIYFRPVWRLYHWLIPIVLYGAWQIRHKPLILSYCVFAMLSALTIGKIGSSLNYLLEFWLAVCILATMALSQSVSGVMAEGTRQRYSSFLEYGIYLLYLIGWQQIFHVPWTREYTETNEIEQYSPSVWSHLNRLQTFLPFWYLDPFAEKASTTKHIQYFTRYPSSLDYTQMTAVEQELSSFEGAIFSSDLNFTLSSGRELSLQPFEFTQLARQGQYAPTPWYECLQSQCFAALVLTYRLDQLPKQGVLGWDLTPTALQLMRSNYQSYKIIGKYYLYLPKGREE